MNRGKGGKGEKNVAPPFLHEGRKRGNLVGGGRGGKVSLFDSYQLQWRRGDPLSFLRTRESGKGRQDYVSSFLHLKELSHIKKKGGRKRGRGKKKKSPPLCERMGGEGEGVSSGPELGKGEGEHVHSTEIERGMKEGERSPASLWRPGRKKEGRGEKKTGADLDGSTTGNGEERREGPGSGGKTPLSLLLWGSGK